MTAIQRPSPNFSKRKQPISAIVIHDTESKTAEEALSWFANPASKVSAHYVIDTDGTVYQCVDLASIAWHAGVSDLWGTPNVNDVSIGIELVDDDDTSPYPDPQIVTLVDLLVSLCLAHRIPLHRIVGHEHIARPLGRKKDPGPDFPWFEVLAATGAHLSEALLRG